MDFATNQVLFQNNQMDFATYHFNFANVIFVNAKT